MRAICLGSADAFNGGGRGNSCFLIEDAAGRFLVDCGPTALAALRRLGVAPSSIDLVAVTHLHGDHFAGLPFLFLAMEEIAPERRTPVAVVGPPGARERIEAIWRLAYPEIAARGRPFALEVHEIAPGEAVEAAGRRFAALAARHGGPEVVALSYRIDVAGGRTVAVTGDTGPAAPLAALAKGADLFICECTFPAARARPGAAHLSVADVARLRPSWAARRVWLTHLSPASREEARSLPGVEVADDGDAIEF